jgi:hypothetical protein
MARGNSRAVVFVRPFGFAQTTPRHARRSKNAKAECPSRIGLVRNRALGIRSLSCVAHRDFSNIHPPREPPLLR